MKKLTKGMFLSIAGGIVLLLQVFGLKIDAPYVNEIIEAICAVLIVLGIVTTATEDKSENDDGGEKDDGDDVSGDNDDKASGNEDDADDFTDENV